MTEVTISSKYQVTIPKTVRESMEIFAGQKVQVLIYRNRIELIPIKPIKKMKGFLKGINTDVERDKDRI
ncbi:MAG: AbrB/MazE/SpoVT family DNA-binding domain-containing protein [Thiomargarita sp.]|nr:AbrB/MazE/SpoVT family DNA-binding domain-containing protein [Thiomargarita sp.]